jgi:recombinational DNA repair protein (RecF pathway)
MTYDDPVVRCASPDDPLAYFRKRYGKIRSEQVGTVGMAGKTATFSDPTMSNDGRNRSDAAQLENDRSDRSDRADERSDQKKPSKINVVPTGPTVPIGIDATDIKCGRQAPVMPKCAICGTSIPTDGFSSVPVDDGLVHRSCAELGIPSRRR